MNKLGTWSGTVSTLHHGSIEALTTVISRDEEVFIMSCGFLRCFHVRVLLSDVVLMYYKLRACRHTLCAHTKCAANRTSAVKLSMWVNTSWFWVNVAVLNVYSPWLSGHWSCLWGTLPVLWSGFNTKNATCDEQSRFEALLKTFEA